MEIRKLKIISKKKWVFFSTRIKFKWKIWEKSSIKIDYWLRICKNNTKFIYRMSKFFVRGQKK